MRVERTLAGVCDNAMVFCDWGEMWNCRSWFVSLRALVVILGDGGDVGARVANILRCNNRLRILNNQLVGIGVHPWRWCWLLEW